MKDQLRSLDIHGFGIRLPSLFWTEEDPPSGAVDLPYLPVLAILHFRLKSQVTKRMSTWMKVYHK